MEGLIGSLMRISGFPARAIGAVPSRKSKSHPRSACVTCCAYMRPKPRGYWISRGVHSARRRASSSSATRSVRPALGHVQLDDVAIPHERQRAPGERFRRDVQDARAVARPAHPRVRHAHHVADALREQLLRNRQHAPLRHPGAAERSGVLQHEHGVGRHGQRRIVDPRLEVVVVPEHDGRSRVLQQPPLRGRVLDDRAVGRQVAAQDRNASFGTDRPIARGDDLVVAHRRVVQVLRRASGR